MAIVQPFRAVRPAKDKVHLVSTRSVDGYKSTELNAKLAENPFSFLHVIKPDFGQENKSKPGSTELLKKIKNKFIDFQKKGIFITDDKESLYIYRQEKDGHFYTGIMACASIDDYFNDVIKKHEQTITDKEVKLKSYLEICDFNAEPVCISYPNDAEIDSIVQVITNTVPEYDFTVVDATRHTLWVVNDSKIIQKISKRFDKIPAVYIADGHHRSASSSLLGKEKRAASKNNNTTAGYNYFLSVFFPENQLTIYDFNRVVTDTYGLTKQQLLAQIAENFDVSERSNKPIRPGKLHQFTMYFDGKWFCLQAKKKVLHDSDPVGTLDAAILSDYLLSPVLNITDLKTDKRIGFVPGIKGPEELQTMVDSGKYKIAFGLFPVTMQQLKNVADAHKIMPPKSTWVEPKLRSGLVVYSLTNP